MSLSKSERTKQNQQNALHSTGPRSVEGKRISAINSFLHGLTSQALTLPHENPGESQAQLDAWNDACQPQGHLEESLVGQIALATIRLGRLAKAENEVIADQSRSADTQWVRSQELRLLELTRLIRIDPARALIELKSFGGGVDWLIHRWNALKDCFHTFQRWNNLELIYEAICLEGGCPTELQYEPIAIYEFAWLACGCTENHENVPAFVDLLSHPPGEWTGRFTSASCDPERARSTIAHLIEERLAELSSLAEYFAGVEEASRKGAVERAGSPHDSPDNRLLLRYRKAAESGFEKALKTLQKLQAERQKADENARKREKPSARAKAPNEPNSGSEASRSAAAGGVCAGGPSIQPPIPDHNPTALRVVSAVKSPRTPASEVAATVERVV
jgi:hypothetical protein